jgi:hypothetical protein
VCGVVCVPPHSRLSSCAALPRHVIQVVRHQRYTEFTIGQKNRTCVITLTISYSRPFDSIRFVCSKQQLSTHTHTQHKITQYSIPVRCPLHAIHLSQSTSSSPEHAPAELITCLKVTKETKAKVKQSLYCTHAVLYIHKRITARRW